MKIINREIGYAIKALCFMVKEEKDIVTTGQMATYFKISRPFLRKILGPEGYGVYASAYPIFVYVYILTNAGIPVAISKMVSELVAIGNYKDAVRTFKIARFLLLILGMIMSLLMLIFAAPLAKATESTTARLAIIALAPTILISAVLSAYRGYFQGRGNMTPTAVSQVLEQIANTIFSLVFAAFFIKYGIAAGAAGGTIGTSVGALVAVIYMIYSYEKNKVFRVPKGYSKLAIERFTTKKLIKKLLSYAVPMTICLGIQQAGLLIDLWLVQSRMLDAGIATKQVTILWGVLTQYTTLINVPIAIISSLAITILPSISSLMALKDKKAVRNKINYAFRLCFLISVPSAVGLAVLAKPIIYFLQYDSDVSRLLIYGSLVIILMAVVSIQTSILQGLGKQKSLLINSVITSLLQLILLYVLLGIPSINILGYGITLLVTSIVGFILNISVIKKNCYIEFSAVEILIDICLSIFLYFVLKILDNTLPNSMFITKNIVIIIVGFSLLFFSLFLRKQSKQV